MSLRTLASPLKTLVRGGFFCAKRLGVPGLDFADQRMAVILRYHSVGHPSGDTHLYARANITLAPRVFERQVAYLARCYRVIRMDDLVEALDGGRVPPRNAVVITFDDGYLDNYEYAFPILRKYGVSAMFYVVTGCLGDGRPMWTSELRYLVLSSTAGRLTIPTLDLDVDLGTEDAKDRAIRTLTRRLAALPRAARDETLREMRRGSRVSRAAPRRTMLTWKEVGEMHRGGMEFGAHTVSHPLLPSIPVEEAGEEIAASKDALEAHLHTPVRHFAYPNPGGGIHADATVKRLVGAAGFTTAVTSRGNYVMAGDDRLEFRRLATTAKPWGLPWDLERDALGKRFLA